MIERLYFLFVCLFYWKILWLFCYICGKRKINYVGKCGVRVNIMTFGNTVFVGKKRKRLVIYLLLIKNFCKFKIN